VNMLTVRLLMVLAMKWDWERYFACDCSSH
jgi:hypothetical protein